jgi:hypothetical protein
MRPLVVTALLALLALARPAAAWTEARPAGLVTELAVDRDGGATVTLRMRWRVLAGRLRAFELAELPTDFTLLDATATDESGNAIAVSTRPLSPGRLEVSFAEEGGLRRGSVDVLLHYTTSLRAQGAIRRVGRDAVVEVATVPWERGLEATELRVALPASVRRAQWLADETPGIDATVTSEPGRDVARALRRHLPAGTRWTARLVCDPALFPWLDGPQQAPAGSAPADRRHLAPLAVLATLLALVLGGAATWLTRRRRGESLLRLPASLRALPIALAALGGAIQSLALLRVPGAVSGGALVAAVGFALAIPRLLPLVAVEASLPGRMWPEARALATARERTPYRWLRLASVGAILAGIVLVLAAAVTRRVWLGIVAVDLALVGMAAVATLRRLTPSPDARVLQRIVRSVARKVGREGTARLAWRVSGDGRACGSVRLRVVPRPGHRLARGVRALECAVGRQAGLLRWHESVSLFVRAERGTPLERALQLSATRVGRLEISPDGDELALIAPLTGPERRQTLRELAALMPLALVRAPASAVRPADARPTLANDDAVI